MVTVDGEGEKGGIDVVIIDRVKDLEGVVIDGKGVVATSRKKLKHCKAIKESYNPQKPFNGTLGYIKSHLNCQNALLKLFRIIMVLSLF
jgi:hypothetical protein